MANTVVNETLVTEFTGDLRQLERKFQEAQSKGASFVARMNSTLNKVTFGGSGAANQAGGFISGMAEAVKLLPGLNLLAAGVSKVAGAMQSGIGVGFDYRRVMEEGGIAFEVMLKSADKAQKHLQELDRFAIDSPFDLTTLVKSSELVQALGFNVSEVTRVLRIGGDAARGNQEKLEGIITALGQMRNKGKVSFEEMNQLIERGIPAWKYLGDAVATTDAKFAKLTGEQRTQQIMKWAERGELASKQAVEAILRGMEGDFGGIGKRIANETAGGLESQFRDVAAKRAGEATKGLFNGYKEMLRAGTATLGSDTVAGLAQGIGDQSDRLLGAGKEMAGALIMGARKELKIESPSKVFIEIGEMSAEGFAVGFESYMQGATTARVTSALSQMTARARAEMLLEDRRVRAMLDAIGYAEGTDNRHGYATKVGGGHQGSLDRKDRSIVNLGRGLRSSASGRYQFLNSTWDSVSQQLGLTDFSARSQDLAAVELLRQRGAIRPLQNNNFAGAVSAARKEWASFPNAGYGQGERSLASMQAVYERSLSNGGVSLEAFARSVDAAATAASSFRSLVSGGGTPQATGGRTIEGGSVVVPDVVADLDAMLTTSRDIWDETHLTVQNFQAMPGAIQSATAAAIEMQGSIEGLHRKSNATALALREGFEDAFVSAFDHIDEGFKGVTLSMLQSFMAMIQEMLLRAAAAKIGEALFGGAEGGGFLSGFLKILGIGAGAVAGGAGGGGGASAWFGTPYFAEGGYLPAGQWGIAGERGAEPIYGGKTGLSIIPHDVAAQAAGGDGGKGKRLHIENLHIEVKVAGNTSRASADQVGRAVLNHLRALDQQVY